MKLSQLFSIYPRLHWGEAAAAEVTGICADSRAVEKGHVFVAVRGETVDSHRFLPQVCGKGVVAVVVEDAAAVPESFVGAVLQVPSGRQALNRLAARFYGEPSEKLYCVGVTGTNGKSTITYMVESVLGEFGWPTGVIGTIGHHLGGKKWPTELTTPDGLILQKRLSEFVSLDAKALCMEVSSIALEQGRIGAVSFDAAVFTNLTRDHLDYHGDMENYFQAKQKLFTEAMAASKKTSRFAIVNGDDPYGRRLAVSEGTHCWYYGQKDCDIAFRVLSQDFITTRVEVRTPRGEGLLRLKMPGLHNVYNAMAAVGVGLAAGISLEKCLTALENFSGVPGRLQAVENDRQLHIFVDYAHTDDALANVLRVLRAVREVSRDGGRILTVFGCGGNRDTGKRPLMGRTAYELSDFVFVTSDNPREEDPQAILRDIIKGMPEKPDAKVFVEVDRRKAMERALRMAQPHDVLLIAGKGHEDYQIIGKTKHHFSDVETMKELLACLPRH